ncbi:MAG: hypothetical protein ABR915_03580 [Thermoguttaceae bacterium]|jgi:hypothetical protein
MPAIFQKLGISFQYPENWTLDEQDARAGRGSVTVYSPGGAFWSVAVHSQPADPAEMSQLALDAMRQEYEGLEVEEAHETIAGHDLTGYDLNFFYLDLISTSGIRSLRVGRTTYTIFYQAEDREFDRVRRVFEAMTTSLLQGIGS